MNVHRYIPHVCVYVCYPTCIHACTYVYIHIHTYILCIRKCVYTHTYKNIQEHTRSDTRGFGSFHGICVMSDMFCERLHIVVLMPVVAILEYLFAADVYVAHGGMSVCVCVCITCQNAAFCGFDPVWT
jgi:hypothetical protein